MTISLNAPVVEVLGATTLATNGSYTSSAQLLFPGYTLARIGVSATYTRGTSGGLPLFKLKWLVGDRWIYDTSPTGGQTVSGATVETPIGLTVIPGPAPATSSPLLFGFDVDVFPRASGVQVEVAELDATKVTPGSITTITISAWV